MKTIKLWTLNKKESQWVEDFAKQESLFHLADGHHHSSTLPYRGSDLSTFSFLVAKDQLKNQAFTWAIKDRRLAKKR